MTDDQTINSLVKFALEVHHPAPIPVGDILLRKYHCDHRQKDIILIQIEHYKLMELLDKNSGSEMRFTEDGLKVATSDNPIEAINKLRADRNKPLIDKSININGNMIGSQAGHGSVFGNFESKNSFNEIATQEDNANTKNNKISEQETIGQKIYKWTDHKLISILIGGILGFIATKILYWLGWLNC
jgi:hypothetical protein